MRNLIESELKMFCREFLKTGNSTAAARTLGYSNSYAARKGSELLWRHETQKVLREMLFAECWAEISFFKTKAEQLDTVGSGAVIDLARFYSKYRKLKDSYF